jgi:hypothetical protein
MLTFGCGEVQYVAVLSEHVDLFNARDRLDIELLERALQLFVVLRRRGFRLPHDLPAHSALSTYIVNAKVL